MTSDYKHYCFIGYVNNYIVRLFNSIEWLHSEKILYYYSCIGACLEPQNTVAEIWSNAW